MGSAYWLDVVGLTLSCLYIPLAAAPLILTRDVHRTSIRNFTIAIRIYSVGMVVAGSNAIVQAADVGNDGPLYPGIWVAAFGCALMSRVAAKRRRELRCAAILGETAAILAEGRKL